VDIHLRDRINHRTHFQSYFSRSFSSFEDRFDETTAHFYKSSVFYKFPTRNKPKTITTYKSNPQLPNYIYKCKFVNRVGPMLV
jgi:hypothetical protein